MVFHKTKTAIPCIRPHCAINHRIARDDYVDCATALAAGGILPFVVSHTYVDRLSRIAIARRGVGAHSAAMRTSRRPGVVMGNPISFAAGIDHTFWSHPKRTDCETQAIRLICDEITKPIPAFTMLFGHFTRLRMRYET